MVNKERSRRKLKLCGEFKARIINTTAWLVVADERSIGGIELQVQRVEILQLVTEYPITPKEHGIEFLMNRRHLWLRSQRQWAAMRGTKWNHICHS